MGPGGPGRARGKGRDRADRLCHEIDGSGAGALNMPAGGSLCPTSAETVAARLHYVHQDGQAVYKYAVRKMVETSAKLLKTNNITAGELGCFIPHQAKQADHSFYCGAPGPAAGAGDHQHRPLRKHYCRHHPSGHADGARRPSTAASKPGPFGFGWCGLHRGRLPPPLGDVSPKGNRRSLSPYLALRAAPWGAPTWRPWRRNFHTSVDDTGRH